MLKKIYRFIIPALFFRCYLLAIIDLDQGISDFILETKKIEIPGYSDAFNPAIIRWNGAYLMCFRIRDPLTAFTNQIATIWLDDGFNPIGRPSLLSIQFSTPFLPAMTQDPRLVQAGHKLYIVFNDMVKIGNGQIRRMYIGEMQEADGRFIVNEPQALLKFEGENENKHEKNWVPFEFGGQLHLSENINPHHVLRTTSEPYVCETLAFSHETLQWDWGILRGGTPALRDGEEYLAFFHSSKTVPTVQSEGKNIQHYVMGAYTFQGHPPFKLTRISPVPIIAHTFYKEPYYKTWKPLRVVFPSGFVFDDKHIWVSYGRQDHEVCIIKLDKEALYKSLVPVEQ